MVWRSKESKLRMVEMEGQLGRLVANINDLLVFLPPHLQARASAEQPPDKLRVLSEYLSDLKDNEQKRSWSMNGIKQLVDTIRNSSDDIHALAGSLIGFVVKYVGLYQGALFLGREQNDEKVLHLIGHYAGNDLRHTERVLPAENGMLGQCHLEGKTIYCENIPKNYCKISSGLGASDATALLITPLKVGDHVTGVMEFASFHQLTREEIAFIERCAEIIASRLVKAQESAELQSLRVAYRAVTEDVNSLRARLLEANIAENDRMYVVRESTIL